MVASGRAFCFLPLPIYTGMPARLHINGYFELSSNRRDIWCEWSPAVLGRRMHPTSIMNLILWLSARTNSLSHIPKDVSDAVDAA